MADSVIISGGGSLARPAPSEMFATPPVTQGVNSSTGISVVGINAQGEAPFWQAVALTAPYDVTLPVAAFRSSSAFKDGQRLTVINASAAAITLPANALYTGSLPEILDSKQMIELFYKAPHGWLPLDDDFFALPIVWTDGNPADTGRQRMKATEKGLRLRNGNIGDPSARLHTTSMAAAGKRVGADYTIGYEDFTVLLDDPNLGTFSLPNPTTCPDRILNLGSLKSILKFTVIGGSKVRQGNADLLQIPAGSVAQLQAIQGVWYRIGGL